jgi:small subunit ribosomal protein S21
MIIINLKPGENIEKALKSLKSKVIKSKQNQILNNKKSYTKKSVERRNELLKAIYLEKKSKS